MTVNISLVGGAAAQFFDDNGDPLSGGKLFTYAAGTTTPQTTYTSSTGVTPHTNPIVLDAAGRVSAGGEIWLTAGVDYKFVLTDANNTLVGTWDNIGTFTSDANFVQFVPGSAGAVATTVQQKLRETVSVFDFMTPAQIADVQAGTLLIDVTLPLQTAINAATRGVFLIPKGYYKTTATIFVSGKNAQNDATQSNLELSAYGAKIVSSVTGDTPILHVDSCKRLLISGLELSGSANTPLRVTGLWYSTFTDCFFGAAYFGGVGTGFSSAYWNKFQMCGFGPIVFNTGVLTGPRYEFNANTFDNCRISGGEYAFKKYGSNELQDAVFINCDLSYQSISILYVDEPTNGNMCFIGGYLDSALGFPANTKGLQLDFVGSIYNPNSANVSSFVVETASNSTSKGAGGVRTGSRIPTSSYNLINNGDLRAGTSNINLVNATPTVVAGTGVFGQYINFTSSVAFGAASFTSLPVPVSGSYTLTVIGRANASGSSSTSCNGVFGVINLDSSWSVSSFTTTIAQGNSVAFAITNGTTGSFDIDIAYVGLTYGSSAPLFAPIHPSADKYSPGTQQGGFTDVALNATTMGGVRVQTFNKTYTASTSSTPILNVSSLGNATFSIDVYYVDGAFPNGTFVQKLYVASAGSGTIVNTVSLAQENKAQSLSGSATDYLTWSATVVANQIQLSATALAATGGTGNISMVLSGTFNGGTVL